MSSDSLKLTTYFGERDRSGDAYLADALVDLYAHHDIAVSAVFRGVEGFGLKHRVQTERLLSLSEDLPMVSVAVDRRERIQAVLPAVAAAHRAGLITLEDVELHRGTLAAAGPHDAPGLGIEPGDAVELTIYVGRRERVGGRPAHLAIVDELHRAHLAGATVLLGVDGTIHGTRRRARLMARNAQVPLMIVSVADAGRVAAVLPRLERLLADPLVTLEPSRVCKRDGVWLAEPQALPDPDGDGPWQRLTVYSGEQARHQGRPLHTELVRRLRREGAMGATALRGLWGYHGDHAPHGDRFWSVRRHVPIVTVVVDRPRRIARWFAIVDELTAETGLVTSEIVPALRAGPPHGPDDRLGLAGT